MNRSFRRNKHCVHGIVYHSFSNKVVVKDHWDVQLLEFFFWSNSTKHKQLRSPNCPRRHYHFTMPIICQNSFMLFPILILENNPHSFWFLSFCIKHNLLDSGIDQNSKFFMVP
ncbi:hypothetical protein V8G54_000950 [Vigna mungo]|uniref:Uncharacterized protein n=1 Tax=Vigna mungo TaxID=3915 RepID=A0AAQ3P5I5_VIGMU